MIFGARMGSIGGVPARGLLILLVALGGLGCGGGGDHSEDPAASHAGARYASAPAAEVGEAPSYTPSGRIVADSGFRPDPDGFGFPNYSTSHQELAAEQMVDLFGRDVCSSEEREACVLTPPAEVWMDNRNKELASNGHCLGFSITSLMMFHGLLRPADYGGLTASALPEVGNLKLQARIAESHALWYSRKVKAAKFESTPNRTLDFLVNRLKRNPDESYTMVIYKRDNSAGHAITPYAVEDKGNGRASVLVYDNNYPRVTRAVEFDRSKDSWSYQAATLPSLPAQEYAGEGFRNTPLFLPTTPGAGIQPCPFCYLPPGSASRTRYTEVVLNGDSINHSHLLITDERGRRTGYVDGRIVNEIPGARVLPPVLVQTWRLSPEPVFQIPPDTKFSVLIDGDNLKAPDTESLSVVGPGHAAVVADITLRPNEKNRVEVTANGTELVYRTDPDHAQSPRLEIGLERPGPDHKYAITPNAIAGGSTLAATARPKRKRLTVDADDVKNTTQYALDVALIRPSGSRAFDRKVVSVPGGTSTTFQYDR